MRFLLFFTFLLFLSTLSAQVDTFIEAVKKDTVVGKISHTFYKHLDSKNPIDSTFVGLREIKDDRIDLLIEDYTKNKKINGYRIQIFSSSSNRWEAVKARSEFLKKYPEDKSYLVYQAPNYKVRIGDYLTRLKAHESLELIKIDFPSAFIVVDEIDPKTPTPTKE